MPNLTRGELADLNVFLTIVRRRSFRLAALDLGLTTSALSHAMRKLEERLEVRLLNRTSRSVAATAAGEELAEALAQGFDTIGGALEALESHRSEPIGRLRINVPRDASLLLVSPALPDFFATSPQVHLEVVVEDRMVDIIADGFDAGIRYGATVPKDMVAVPLTPPLRWVVVGSPGYFEAKGQPSTPDDLYRHSCIQMRIGDNSTYAWELGNDPAMVRLDVPGPMRVNDTDAQIDAALRGIGLAYCLEARILPELKSGALQVALPDWVCVGAPLCMYYASRRQSPPGLRQLVEAIRRVPLF
jgi:DNA-binding transcriptional LysR family regulator